MQKVSPCISRSEILLEMFHSIPVKGDGTVVKKVVYSPLSFTE